MQKSFNQSLHKINNRIIQQNQLPTSNQQPYQFSNYLYPKSYTSVNSPNSPLKIQKNHQSYSNNYPTLQSSRRLSTTSSQVSERFKRTSQSRQDYVLNRSKSKQSLQKNQSLAKLNLQYIKYAKIQNQEDITQSNKSINDKNQKVSQIKNKKANSNKQSLQRNQMVMTEKNCLKNFGNSNNFNNLEHEQIYYSKLQPNKNKCKNIVENKIDYQIKISDLEKQLHNQKRNKQKQQKKVKILEDQLIKTKKQINTFLEENQTLKKLNLQDKKNYEKMQKQLNHNQTNLAEAYFNLQKLKKHIQLTRAQQLAEINKNYQYQISKIKQEKNLLKNKIQSLEQSNIFLKSQIQNFNLIVLNSKSSNVESVKEKYLLKQIQNLKKQLNKTQTMRQQALQENVLKLQSQIKKNKQQINSLQIKLSCVNKKNSDQISQIKKSKQNQLGNLKKKIAKANEEILKQKSLLSQKTKQNKQVLSRSCFIKNNNSRKDSQNFDLELSPESCPQS